MDGSCHAVNSEYAAGNVGLASRIDGAIPWTRQDFHID